MGKAQKIDHIGIAVTDLKEAVPLFELILGQKVSHQEEVADQKVRTAFFELGDSSLELLEASHPESPIAKFVLSQGRGGVHHICLQVKDLEDRLAVLKKAGIRLIDEKPRFGVGGKKIAFLHPKSTGGVLLELVEA